MQRVASACCANTAPPAAAGSGNCPRAGSSPEKTPESTARRELVEEAGREAQRWESLGSILSSPGVFAETIHLFLARDLAAVPLAHEQHEVIEIHWVEMAEAVRQALNGELRDAKTVIGLLRAAARVAGKPLNIMVHGVSQSTVSARLARR